LFEQPLDVVKTEVTRVLMTVRIQSEEQVTQAARALEQQADQLANLTYTHPNEDGSISQVGDPATAAAAAAVPKVGRNDPCPCPRGRGKNYKRCHGRLA
jgi:preprotein translocase subunit SecA